MGQRLIDAYLRFLLRFRWVVLAVVGVMTAFFVHYMANHMAVFTNFFDLYPPKHDYIQLYTKYRNMFGTANVVQIVIEMRDEEGTIFDRVETIELVDEITTRLLREVPGVNPEQVLSITHPKLKTSLAAGSGIKVVPLTYPRLPVNDDDLEFFRQKVYTTEGVRGFFTSPDDRATQIVAGFWEEFFDLELVQRKLDEIVADAERSGTHKLYVTGFPIMYAYFLEMTGPMIWVLSASVLTMILILWFEFRSWQGVWIPVFSGALSAIWGLGFGGLCGLNLDPLVLVIPLLISARAHSHSVQSMERYHEEYEKLGDRDAAILSSYRELFGPAMVAIVSDSIAILTLYVARIPVVQNIAILSAFWIFSIFISVITLHPIILSFTKPPKHHDVHPEPGMMGRAYDRFADFVFWLSTAWRPKMMVVVIAGSVAWGMYYAHQLPIGNTTPSEALLYPDHPVNVGFRKVNEYFAGASQLVIIAEGKKKEALKNAETLAQLELFAQHMEKQGAGGSITVAGLLKKISRTFREGEPKWNMLPTSDDHVGQFFFLLTSGSRRGEMDRFFDISYTNATITMFYRDYDHETITRAIAEAKRYIDEVASDEDSVRYLLAGGLLGILAAVNEEVSWSYRVNITLILLVVFILSYFTYRSVVGALIVMLPSLTAQPISEAFMFLAGIDMNINSLPVAAVGIGIGIDYGYYVLSRIVEEAQADPEGNFEEAIRRAIHTTGKTVLFTGLSLTASIVYWCFFPMKFQAEMAMLLVLLLLLHLVGALLFIPPMVNLLRPSFATRRPST